MNKSIDTLFIESVKAFKPDLSLEEIIQKDKIKANPRRGGRTDHGIKRAYDRHIPLESYRITLKDAAKKLDKPYATIVSGVKRCPQIQTVPRYVAGCKQNTITFDELEFLKTLNWKGRYVR